MLLRLLTGMCSLFYMTISSGAPPKESTLPLERAEQKKTSDKRPEENLNDPLKSFELATPQKEEAGVVVLKKKDISFYGYRQSFSTQAGVIRESGDLGFVGFQYLFPSDTGKTWEAGIDVYNGGDGAFKFAYRHTFFHLEVFRPFLKAGGAFRSDGEGQLASLVRFDNLRAEASAGLEYLLIPPFSLRAEAELSLGTDSTATLYRLGLSWGWY